ncbi:hypothetical protein EJ05DRAFT_257190 [Pseudovirgaria hyperparasitica]|uniref:Uncharacterized protein n=1 Tax=Pseudovirgaria hyperparasitica TaxID=470096 RepID=A0A6A6WET9_9PEZI|nr:uncharacterized protein EJ05DRAFT_257190 [Pseudovirgaria hyperparasitica]KAF2761233.1 hypothetical protein EJ05DRAFT_257190 [Pseudovirgaria hyperparasitica]
MVNLRDLSSVDQQPQECILVKEWHRNTKYYTTWSTLSISSIHPASHTGDRLQKKTKIDMYPRILPTNRKRKKEGRPRRCNSQNTTSLLKRKKTPCVHGRATLEQRIWHAETDIIYIKHNATFPPPPPQKTQKSVKLSAQSFLMLSPKPEKVSFCFCFFSLNSTLGTRIHITFLCVCLFFSCIPVMMRLRIYEEAVSDGRFF